MRAIAGFNRKIQPSEVRLIGADGQQMGIIPTREAFRRADEAGMDLVGVQAKVQPPVCKIMDYGKFKYDKKKAANVAKKNQQLTEVKEMKFRPKIGDHDLEVKTKKICEFLSEGNKVKVTVMFRGREIIHPEVGTAILDKVVEKAASVGEVESKPRQEGRFIYMVLMPARSKK